MRLTEAKQGAVVTRGASQKSSRSARCIHMHETVAQFSGVRRFRRIRNYSYIMVRRISLPQGANVFRMGMICIFPRRFYFVMTSAPGELGLWGGGSISRHRQSLKSAADLCLAAFFFLVVLRMYTVSQKSSHL